MGELIHPRQHLGLNAVFHAALALGLLLVAALARPKPNWKESLALGVGLSVFAAVVFVWALSQPLPLGWWPQ